jgi:hypothetical protein
MASRAARSRRNQAAAPAPARPPASQDPPGDPSEPTAVHRDVRRWIYAGLDLLFASAYAFAIWKVIPNRLPSAAVHLGTFPVAALAMAVGMALGGPRGWWTAVVAGSLALASLFVLIVRILISAAFLAGVYGAFGKAAATFALVMVALVVELVALLPVVQVKYLMTRSGRRAFGRPGRGA